MSEFPERITPVAEVVNRQWYWGVDGCPREHLPRNDTSYQEVVVLRGPEYVRADLYDQLSESADKMTALLTERLQQITVLQAQLDALRPVLVDQVPEAWKDGRVVEGWVDEWWLPLRLIIDPGSQSQQWVCAEHWRELKDGTWGPYPADDVTFYYPTWLRLPLTPQEAR